MHRFFYHVYFDISFMSDSLNKKSMSCIYKLNIFLIEMYLSFIYKFYMNLRPDLRIHCHFFAPMVKGLFSLIQIEADDLFIVHCT